MEIDVPRALRVAFTVMTQIYDMAHTVVSPFSFCRVRMVKVLCTWRLSMDGSHGHKRSSRMVRGMLWRSLKFWTVFQTDWIGFNQLHENQCCVWTSVGMGFHKALQACWMLTVPISSVSPTSGENIKRCSQSPDRWKRVLGYWEGWTSFRYWSVSLLMMLSIHCLHFKSAESGLF